MTERDDIAFGTPEAELLGAAAFPAAARSGGLRRRAAAAAR